MEREYRILDDLGQSWDVLRREKWRILALASAASLIAAVVVLVMTPVYKATATLLIESQPSNVVSIEQVYGLENLSQQHYDTQFEILNSRPLVVNVVNLLDLANQPGFADEESWFDFDLRAWIQSVLPNRSKRVRDDTLDDVIETYHDNLAIEPIPNTQLVNIEFESEDPDLAASIANNHAQAYIQSILGMRAGVTDSAADWMLERLADLKGKLEASERQLQDFREQEQLIDVEGLKSLPAREINELTSRLVEIRSELSQDRIAYRQIFQGRSTPVEDLQGISAILDDPVVQELQAAEAQTQRKVAELAKRYGPLHPEMIAAQSELDKATESLRSQRRNVSQAIKKKYEATRAAEIELVNELDRAKQLYQQVGRKESKLLALQREADTNRTLYDLFYNRLSETTATGG
ncbi:MAG: GumC family protein, partial [Gammaproteobacteria bacterium]|nr:GumC family protein [Gammaproteobacteria bacterium]